MGVLILLARSLRLLYPYFPQWTKPIIKEAKAETHELDDAPQPQFAWSTYGLLAITALGLIQQISSEYFPIVTATSSIFPILAWVSKSVDSGTRNTDFVQAIGVAIVVFDRPRTASLSLLFLLASISLAELAITISDPMDPYLAFGSLLALAGIIVIFNMPLRDSSLPKDDISPVYGPPTVKLRTPEDNLTPLQYMTVSWMGPLIQKGITRKMDDEDVWDLGWEFKHARLHEAFRKLEGSVTRRIFVANGMDALRTTSLNLLRLCASKSKHAVHYGETRSDI